MHNPDRQLWKLWAGITLITVVGLPFVVRQEGLMAALDFCLTMFNPF